ncbi:MAG: alpha/beta hydrolase [Candidatus Heimdallarchaeota archaeon]|nr:alpha/beta hydrolase [Candidatus Heimdallarchaeota archaeon]
MSLIKLLFSFISFWIKVKIKGFREELLDHSFITNLVFFPRKATFPDIGYLDRISFTMKDGVTLSSFIYRVDSSYPTILLFHGNGEIINDYIHTSLYTDVGFNLAVVDFRGYGESEGKPSFRTLFSDPLEIYTQLEVYLKENSMNQRIVVFGRSLGSICASVIAANNPENMIGVMYESGFANLHKLWMSGVAIPGIKITDEMLSEWSNDRFMRNIQAPTVIIHGDQDQVIPHDQAILINNAIQKSILCTIPGAGHNNIMLYKEKYQEAIRTFKALAHLK